MGWKYIATDPLYFEYGGSGYRVLQNGDYVQAEDIPYITREHADKIQATVDGPTAGDYVPSTTYLVGPTGPAGATVADPAPYIVAQVLSTPPPNPPSGCVAIYIIGTNLLFKNSSGTVIHTIALT